MTVNSHPLVLTMLAEQRGAEWRTQAERDRLARRAAGASGAPRRQPWSEALAVFAAVVVMVLALLFAAGSTAAQDLPPQTRQNLGPAAAPVLEEDDPDTQAVQKVREAAP